jgi:hypothetical protein
MVQGVASAEAPETAGDDACGGRQVRAGTIAGRQPQQRLERAVPMTISYAAPAGIPFVGENEPPPR